MPGHILASTSRAAISGVVRSARHPPEPRPRCPSHAATQQNHPRHALLPRSAVQQIRHTDPSPWTGGSASDREPLGTNASGARATLGDAGATHAEWDCAPSTASASLHGRTQCLPCPGAVPTRPTGVRDGHAGEHRDLTPLRQRGQGARTTLALALRTRLSCQSPGGLPGGPPVPGAATACEWDWPPPRGAPRQRP